MGGVRLANNLEEIGNKMQLIGCNKCDQIKPRNEFYNSKEVKSGHKAMCKKCCNENGKKWTEKNKEKVYIINRKCRDNLVKKRMDYLFVYKSSMGCQFCKKNTPEFLTLYRTKTGSKSKANSMIHRCLSWKTILDEIDQCDVICNMCHGNIRMGRPPATENVI